jgi:hypothetical protein
MELKVEVLEVRFGYLITFLGHLLSRVCVSKKEIHPVMALSILAFILCLQVFSVPFMRLALLLLPGLVVVLL